MSSCDEPLISNSPAWVKVSIVVPMFDARPFVEQAFATLCDQGLAQGEYELIFVDDCSTDGTYELAEQIASGAEAVRVERLERNSGAGAARNRGLDVARGDYVYFFDVDDRLQPGTLGSLYGRVIENDLDVLFFSADVDYAVPELEETNPQNREYFKRSYAGGIASGRDLLIWQLDNDDFCAQPCLQLTRRSLLGQSHIRFPEGMVNEDNVFVLASTLAAQRCAVLTDAPYTYVVRSGSVTTSTARQWRSYDAHLRLFDYALKQAYSAQASGDTELARVLCSLANSYSLWAEGAIFESSFSLWAPDSIPGTGLTPSNSLSSDDQTVHLLHGVFGRIWKFHLLLGEAEERERVLADKMRKQAEEAEQAQEALQRRIDDIYGSFTWKAGRVVTALPRFLRGIIEKLRRPDR